jgi:hypothetical protein
MLEKAFGSHTSVLYYQECLLIFGNMGANLEDWGLQVIHYKILSF